VRLPPPDPRTHAWRADLAEAALDGIVAAPRYANGVRQRCRLARASLHQAPGADAVQVSELLYGETVTCFEARDGWSWVKGAHDDYVGYVTSDALVPWHGAPQASHVVSAVRAHLYRAPDVKAPISHALYAASPLRVTGASADGRFLALDDGGWVSVRHAAPAACVAPDIAETAQAFLGTPYRWGGRSGDGIDCSGLVQIAVMRAGCACPRDSDQQAASLGADIGTDLGRLQRGDLVFFPGHVGIMADGQRLIHANATAMAVSVDPLARVIDTIRESHPDRPIVALRRLVPSERQKR